MDLATGVASVVGAVEANALKEALNQSGFPATVIK
jgi:Cu+-exporting ATPase